MPNLKKKIFDLDEALCKISGGEWVLLGDVKELLKNKHEGIVFFERDELLNRVKAYKRHNEKRQRKAQNYACIFAEWMIKQLALKEK